MRFDGPVKCEICFKLVAFGGEHLIVVGRFSDWSINQRRADVSGRVATRLELVTELLSAAPLLMCDMREPVMTGVFSDSLHLLRFILSHPFFFILLFQQKAELEVRRKRSLRSLNFIRRSSAPDHLRF